MKKRYIFIIAICAILSLFVSCDGSVNEMLFGGGDDTIKPLSNPGDTIVLGKKADGTKITWMALSVDAENKRALLICEDVLENMKFSTTGKSEYKESDIRTYLTNLGEDGFIAKYGLSTDYMLNKVEDFSDVGLTAQEEDYVFIPSTTEATTGYFETEESRANGSTWFVRTLDSTEGFEYKAVACIDDTGVYCRTEVNENKGLRPAFWYTWN